VPSSIPGGLFFTPNHQGKNIVPCGLFFLIFQKKGAYAWKSTVIGFLSMHEIE
jgi:hypothetical protein